jgi:peptide/nickel transport system substrate-binding protein
MSITIIAGQQLASFGSFRGAGGETNDIVHAGLVTRNAETFEDLPWLAASLPSQSDGTWVVNSDGTMTTTFRLRPNIKWHDGTPFSSHDFVFGYEVATDPKVPYQNTGVVRLMERIEALDDRTVVIHWKRAYPWANTVFQDNLPPLPRHLLEASYRAGEPLEDQLYWSRGFVGLGPYRVVNFEPDQVLEARAFDDYFLGRPKVDRLIYRVVSDPNVALTNVLSNNTDVALRLALTVENGLTARQRWEAAGEGKVNIVPVAIWYLNLSGMNPWFDDVRVRKALMYGIDREAMNESIFSGIEQVAHVPFSPRRPQYARLEPVVTKYPFDAARAQQLLAEAGWQRGGDGVLVNGRGERMSFEARTTTGQQASEQLQLAITSYWRTLGVETQINNVTAAVARDDQHRGRWPGANWQGGPVTPEGLYNAYHSSQIPTTENRWSGSNTARWTRSDALLDQMWTTLDRGRWDSLLVELLQQLTDQLPNHPIIYGSDVTTVRKGLQNVGPRYETGEVNSRTWNVHQWQWS